MIPVTCAIIMNEGMVLATQRGEQMPHPLKWEFPGGKVKDGEKAEVCIVREIREELGIGITVTQPLPEVEYSYGPTSIRLIPFLCRQTGDENIVLSEHKSYRWMALADLENLDWLEADIEVVGSLGKLS